MDRNMKRILLITIILIITASIVWAANYKLHFNGFVWNDSSDYNQIARNIYKGEGFKTSTLRPIDFLYFQQLPHPEVLRPPLYPYMLAGLFTFLGVNDFAVVVCDGIFYVILVALTFLVAMELSNSYKIALFSAITVALSRYFLTVSIMGMSDIVFASLFMFFLLFYLKKQRLIFWHGVIIGF
jgi:4-amino-4-deoxy-L-arabinose transferase-like glycosyltransferase